MLICPSRLCLLKERKKSKRHYFVLLFSSTKCVKMISILDIYCNYILTNAGLEESIGKRASSNLVSSWASKRWRTGRFKPQGWVVSWKEVLFMFWHVSGKSFDMLPRHDICFSGSHSCIPELPNCFHVQVTKNNASLTTKKCIPKPSLFLNFSIFGQSNIIVKLRQWVVKIGI